MTKPHFYFIALWRPIVNELVVSVRFLESSKVANFSFLLIMANLDYGMDKAAEITGISFTTYI